MKFKDLKSGKAPKGTSKLARDVARQLHHANRGYQRYSFDPSDVGNYLKDFLAVHGEEEIAPIKSQKGALQGVYEGIVFV